MAKSSNHLARVIQIKYRRKGIIRAGSVYLKWLDNARMLGSSYVLQDMLRLKNPIERGKAFCLQQNQKVKSRGFWG